MVDVNGNNVPTTWLLMFVNAGANGVNDPLTGPTVTGVSGDDSVIVSPANWADTGFYTGSFNDPVAAPNTLTYFGRVFDASTAAGATHYLDLGLQTSSWVDGSETFEYDVNTQSQAGAPYSWVTIPEPSTMLLAGLGLVVAAARRRFGKK